MARRVGRRLGSEIAPAPDGSVWLGTWGDGAARFADGTIQARYTITDGLPTQYVGALLVASDGTMWAGGDLPGSIGSFNGQEWTLHKLGEELSAGGLLDLAEGPDGTLWAGTQYLGLLRRTAQGWQPIADPEGVTGGRINEIQVDANGTLWCATARGLAFYGDGGWRGQGGEEVYDLEFGPAGTAYLLTGGWIRLALRRRSVGDVASSPTGALSESPGTPRHPGWGGVAGNPEWGLPL